LQAEVRRLNSIMHSINKALDLNTAAREAAESERDSALRLLDEAKIPWTRTGLCSAHQRGEDPNCQICYPKEYEIPFGMSDGEMREAERIAADRKKCFDCAGRGKMPGVRPGTAVKCKSCKGTGWRKI
jgi:hypothetical protein